MKYILVICCLVLETPVFSQITFQKAYGGTAGEHNECLGKTNGIMNTTSDSGYVICNSSISFANPFSQGIYFVRLDQFGDTIFTKTFYRNDYHCYGRSIYETSDGGFIMGVAHSGSGLIKTDAAGNITWSKKLSMSNGYYGMPVAGNSFLCTSSFGNAMYLSKVDMNGNMLFENRYFTINSWYSSSEHFMLYSSYECANTDIISTGYYINGSSNGEILLIRTDSAGNIKFVKSYDSDIYFESAYKVIELADKSIVAVGGWGELKTVILKTDSLGNPIFFKKIGNSQGSNAVAADDKGNLYLTGGTSIVGNALAIITKTNSLGNIIWSKTYENAEVGLCIELTPDKGMVMAGITNSFGAGGYDTYLCKTDSMGDAGCDISDSLFSINVINPIVTDHILLVMPDTVCSNFPMLVNSGTIVSTKCQNFTLSADELQSDLDIELYPNPVTDMIMIDVGENFDIQIHLSVYSISGQLLVKKSFDHTGTITLDLQHLSGGVYFLQVDDGKKSMTRKFIKK